MQGTLPIMNEEGEIAAVAILDRELGKGGQGGA